MKFQLYFFVFFTLFLFSSCQKKELKIPTTDNKGLQEITNFTEIWMFMEVVKNDTILNINDNNIIGSTHWIFHIDKNLKIKKVMPEIQKFQEKRLKKSMHKTEGFNNYLSYSDTISKILSFVEVSQIQFHFDTLQSKKSILKNIEHYKNYNNYHLSFGVNTYYINETKIEKEDFFETLIVFIGFAENEFTTLLHLNFNQELSYQEYIDIKTHLISLQKELFLIDKNEFIFDASKIPECGC